MTKAIYQTPDQKHDRQPKHSHRSGINILYHCPAPKINKNIEWSDYNDQYINKTHRQRSNAGH